MLARGPCSDDGHREWRRPWRVLASLAPPPSLSAENRRSPELRHTWPSDQKILLWRELHSREAGIGLPSLRVGLVVRGRVRADWRLAVREACVRPNNRQAYRHILLGRRRRATLLTLCPSHCPLLHARLHRRVRRTRAHLLRPSLFSPHEQIAVLPVSTQAESCEARRRPPVKSAHAPQKRHPTQREQQRV